ncbi:MAG: Mrp/NBP35 family ATP-binding protein, partial [Planctomycetota bacterium]
MSDRPPAPGPDACAGDALSEAIREALRGVMDPELGRDLVSLGMVKEIRVEAGEADVGIELTTPACPLKHRIESDVRTAALAVPGVKDVRVHFTSRPGAGVQAPSPIAGVRSILAVASAKGGVGKTTVAVNLAVAFARLGLRTGLLDADVFGPSVPRMLGLSGEPQPGSGEGRLSPPSAHGVKAMSLGLLLDPGQPVIWRGPMVHQAIQFSLRQIDWGELDVLVVDLPPGTGDVQLSLIQSVPLAGAVLVCTPQDAAADVSIRGLRLFEIAGVRLLGVVENMSGYVCPGCGRREEIFAHGGGQRLAARAGVPLLGCIPLDPAVRAGGDEGKPCDPTSGSPSTSSRSCSPT